MTSPVERVSGELARNLLPCPNCTCAPEICRRATLRGAQVSIFCPCRETEWYGGKDRPYPASLIWHPSLYQAVCYWQSIAALSGSREKVDDLPF